MNFNTTTFITGTLLSGLASEYLGVSSAKVNIILASLGGFVSAYGSDYLRTLRKTCAPSVKMDQLLDRLKATVGLKFFMVHVMRSEAVLFNKVEGYILHKYVPQLSSSYINDSDSLKLAIGSTDPAIFATPAIDHFKGHKILLEIVSNDKITISSQTMEISGLRDYIKEIVSVKLGTRNITMHQPVFEDYKGKKEDSGDVRTEITWNTSVVQTNKNFGNTILSQKVQKELVDDVHNFCSNEEYYNTKGIPYKRGYLLYGPPGTGKTSIIKSFAAKHGMDVYVINMGEIKTTREITTVFRGTRNSSGYHILCMEDVDRCEFLQNCSWGSKYVPKDPEAVRTLLNEIDGVAETPKRITFMTVNDRTILENIPALIRPGRIDREVELGYCDTDQLKRLYKHYTDSGETLEITEDEFNYKVTPAQVVKFILTNSKVGAEEFKKNLDSIHKIEVSEKKLSSELAGGGRRRSRRTKTKPVTKAKRNLKKLENQRATLPKKIKQMKVKLEKAEEAEEKRKAKRKEQHAKARQRASKKK